MQIIFFILYFYFMDEYFFIILRYFPYKPKYPRVLLSFAYVDHGLPLTLQERNSKL